MSVGPARFVRDTVSDVRMVARGWRWGRRSMVPRSAEAHQVATLPSVFPTAWARRPAARALREVVQTAGLGPLLRAEITPHVSGLDVLGRVRPPVVFVANHASHLDTPLILCSLPDRWRRRTAVAAAADYFFDTWWRAVGSAVVFNTIPIERRGGAPSTTPGDVLTSGWNIVVFPEGTRSTDGWTGRFRLGAAHLAVTHRVPVVPVAIRGSFAAMPRGRGWPMPGRPPVAVRFGDPVVPGDDETVRDFSRRVQVAVGTLHDEDADTWWGSLRRARTGTTPSIAGPDVARWRRIWAASEPPTMPRRRRIWN